MILRLLFISPVYAPANEWGGSVTAIETLVRALAQQGVRVDVYTTNARAQSGLKKLKIGSRIYNGVQINYLNSWGPMRYAFAPTLFRQLLWKIRQVDFVHIQGIWTFPALIGARICEVFRVPYAVSPRGTLQTWALSQKKIKKFLYYQALEKRTIKKAAFIHYTSVEEKRQAPHDLYRLHSVVIPEAVDVDNFGKVNEYINNSDRVVVLIAGRIHKVKGFDLLIPAINCLTEEGINLELHIAGSDEYGYLKQVNALIRKYNLENRVKYLGYLKGEKLLNAFEKAHILAMPSYQENFGLSAAEGMAACRPVIVSENVSIAQDVARAKAGVVVKLEMDSIVRAFSKLARSPEDRKAMGMRGRLFAISHYSPEAVAKLMIESYRRILEKL